MLFLIKLVLIFKNLLTEVFVGHLSKEIMLVVKEKKE